MLNYFSKKLKSGYFIFGLFLCLAPYFLISIFNHPAAFDDYQSAILILNKGSFGFAKYFFETWSGRYTSNLLQGYFNPLIFNNWLIGFKIAPIVLLSLFLLSGVYFFRSISLNFNFRKGDYLIMSLIFSTLYLSRMPNISNIFYWFTGSVVYATGLILFFVLAGSVINYCNTQSNYLKTLYAILSVLALCCSIGTNESMLIALIFLNSVILLICFLFNQKFKLFFCFLMLVGVICAIISIFGSNNSARLSSYHGDQSIIAIKPIFIAILKSVLYAITNIASWLNDLALILCSLLFITFSNHLFKRIQRTIKPSLIRILILIITSICFFSIQAFPSFLGTGDVEPRVSSSIYFFFLLFWFFFILLISQFYNIPTRIKVYFNSHLIKLSIIGLSLFSISGNTYSAYLDLIYRAPTYNNNLLDRYKVLKNNQGKDLYLTPIFEKEYKYPQTIFVKDISTDPKSGENVGVAEYFKVKSIQLSNLPN